jgi:transposase, IS5 family
VGFNRNDACPLFERRSRDGRVAEQLEQSSILLQDLPGTPKPQTVLADLGFRGVDVEVSSVNLIHRGKHKTLNSTQRRWLKRRQAIEPIIGHVKHDHGMRRCGLKGQTGDALHAVLCATGYNLRWLLGAIVRLSLGPIFFVLTWLHSIVNILSHPLPAHRERFRRPNLYASTKCPIDVVRQAN